MKIDQTVDQLARSAAESVRRINHLTIRGPALPAPEVYAILGPLEQMAYGLDQALTQISRALDRSATIYDLYEDDPTRNPENSIVLACVELAAAAHCAGGMGRFLGQARAAIAGQGFSGDGAEPDRTDQ